jgi:alpha-D-ribose 1-methylphosphonate 5-triphosphate synthase subunit PhnH
LPQIAEALVDHEVTFAATADAQEVTDAVLRQTGSRVAPVEEADYVLCLEGGLAGALRSCKEGTPEYPDESATVICEVSAIAEGEGAGDELVLSGPGIKDEARLRVAGLTPEVEAAFREKNAWPPLGADLVLVSRARQVVCLSRYTKLQVED